MGPPLVKQFAQDQRHSAEREEHLQADYCNRPRDKSGCRASYYEGDGYDDPEEYDEEGESERDPQPQRKAGKGCGRQSQRQFHMPSTRKGSLQRLSPFPCFLSPAVGYSQKLSAVQAAVQVKASAVQADVEKLQKATHPNTPDTYTMSFLHPGQPIGEVEFAEASHSKANSGVVVNAIQTGCIAECGEFEAELTVVPAVHCPSAHERGESQMGIVYDVSCVVFTQIIAA
eukprot:6487461-Amphidinium_carterae.2